MRKIAIVNLKGGSGKTTIATTLSAWLAGCEQATTLLDLDPQEAAWGWLARRPPTYPRISALSPAHIPQGMTLSFALRIPTGTKWLVIDTPAGLDGTRLVEVVRGAAAILIPVLPGEMDYRAAAKTISNLLIRAKLTRYSQRIGLIANRVRRRTIGARQLEHFTATLDIPLVATFHDTQAYAHAIRMGLGLGELKSSRLAEERMAWQSLLIWIASRPLEFTARTALGAQQSHPSP